MPVCWNSWDGLFAPLLVFQLTQKLPGLWKGVTHWGKTLCLLKEITMQCTWNLPSILGCMTEPLRQRTWCSGTSFVATNQKQPAILSFKKVLPLIPETMNVFCGRCSEWCSPQISGTRRPRPPGSSSTAESECGTSSHGRSSGWVLPNPLGTASSSLPRRRAEEQKGFEEINIKQNQTFTNWHKPHPYPVSNTTYAFICKTFFIADASQHRNEMSSWTWTKAFKKKKVFGLLFPYSQLLASFWWLRHYYSKCR